MSDFKLNLILIVIFCIGLQNLSAQKSSIETAGNIGLFVVPAPTLSTTY